MTRCWYDQNEENQEQEEGVSLREYDITATPNDFNIQTIFSLIDNGVIKMPPFQRNYVWDDKRASKLIESLLLGLPIPQIFLYEKGKNNFLVIDGQQRLLSIYFFIKQRFPTKKGKTILREYLTGESKIDSSILENDEYFTTFKLKLPINIPTEKNKFNGLKYETLGEYKYNFEILRTIRSVVIKQNEPDDDSSIHEIFNRLNTGGQNLSQQEIRMSIYYSDFYKMITELNEDKRWRNLINQEAIDVRFKDIEILIRVFAMLFKHLEYKPSMTKFINAFSKESMKFDEKTISYLKSIFSSFLDSCGHLDHTAFETNKGQFRISLFEAVFVAACNQAFQNKETLTGKISYESLFILRNNQEFIFSTQESVASKKSVDFRMEIAKAIIAFE